MKRILYTNVDGETINIFERPPFILQKIEGFGSVQNEISYDGSYGMDGATKISDRLAVRDMLIEGTIVADNNEQLMEYRQELAKIFNPKISGALNYKEYDKEYVIDIEVEHAPNFDMENTKRSQKFQLMLKALDPYWTDKSEIDAEVPMAREENLFEFPLEITNDFEFSRLIAGDVIEIQNNGDVAVGAVFTIDVNGILVNPRLYNVITQEYFALNGTFTTGTKLRISTVRGKKRVEQDDGDGWYNIMTKRKVESTFLQIERGINYLQLQADEGVEFTTSYIRFEPKILGV